MTFSKSLRIKENISECFQKVEHFLFQLQETFTSLPVVTFQRLKSNIGTTKCKLKTPSNFQ